MEEAQFRDWLSSYTDAERCLAAFSSQKDFFRVNTIKIPVGDFEALTKLRCSRSKYYGAAFELAERKNFQIGKSWEYFLGLIYPQSLSSILVSLVVGPKPGETVLDVSAAPGSKFSHMAMLMENRGVLVGNDLKEEKLSAIYATINRMNILNCIVTMRDGSKLDWRRRFDKVLLDAPCTALGSGAEAWRRWLPENSKRIGSLQRRMLFSAFDALKPGGELVYSTCTYAKEENEEVVKNLLENVVGARLEQIALDVPHEPGLSEYGDEFKKCYRIYPQHIESEGFFIAKIRKAG
ncbi:MAG TPA: RsmB/NOP family class I SAM-dependent RNA methyltransferase [Candidatus Bilamarchaeum sp.]|nr:RsmB/NOP family class I SAM-dependent RNA methyltransferase [Candidatus Bilamarchaeum sp.]